jgi:hypothetical protein
MAADGGDGQLPGASGPAANALRAVAAAAGVELGPPVQAAPGGDLPPLLPQQVAIARFVLLLKALEIDPVIVPAVEVGGTAAPEREGRAVGRSEDDVGRERRRGGQIQREAAGVRAHAV